MSQTLDIPAQERNRLHLFALNMIEAEAKKIARDADAPARLLGASPFDPQFAEIIRIADLDDLGLAGYLNEGYDVPPEAMQGQRARLKALEGYALIVLSSAFEDQAQRLEIGRDLSYLGAFPTEAPDWTSDTPLESHSARPGTAPEATVRKLPSDGAMMGRVAMVVLIGLGIFTYVLIRIAG